MEGGEVFDAEDGFGVDSLQGGCLRGWESDRWGESAQVENFAFVGGELPVSRKVDIVWIGDEVEFAQDFFSRDSFPFGISNACERDKLVFDGFKSLAVVEDAHAEDAVGRFHCQRG